MDKYHDCGHTLRKHDNRKRGKDQIKRREIPEWLEEQTFGVQYNPNCAKPYLVRLIGAVPVLDWKPYNSWRVKDEPPADLTKDALGFGDTIKEAAEAAREHQKMLTKN